jgi:hypothetical protein
MTPEQPATALAPATGPDYADPALANAELVQLRVRVIALENLLIALLAEASDRQRGLARQMAAYISPRPGFSAHPVTLNAAHHMVHLVDRAHLFTGTAEHMVFGASTGTEPPSY